MRKGLRRCRCVSVQTPFAPPHLFLTATVVYKRGRVRSDGGGAHHLFRFRNYELAGEEAVMYYRPLDKNCMV